MKRSRSSWTTAAEEVFLSIWEQNMEDLRGIRKNSHVYQEMAAEMQKQGYEVNAATVKIKIDNLTAKYRKCKAAIGTTGGSPATWPLYEKVHQIIGGFSINNVEALIEESIEESSCSVASADSSSWPMSPSNEFSPLSVVPDSPPTASASSAPARSAKKKEYERLITVCEKMGDDLEKAVDSFSNSTEELVNLERAKLVAVQELQKDTKRLTDGVLEFLKKF